jgi:hypothetical protein
MIRAGKKITTVKVKNNTALKAEAKKIRDAMV